MQAVYRFADAAGIGRFVDLDDLIRPEGAVFFIELVKNLRPVALAIGKTVEDGQILAFC